MLRDSGVIVSLVRFKDNPYDGATLEPALEQATSMTGKTFDNVLVDKGYRGVKNIGGTDVIIPKKVSPKLSPHHRRKQRKRYARRAACARARQASPPVPEHGRPAAIKPIIGSPEERSPHGLLAHNAQASQQEASSKELKAPLKTSPSPPPPGTSKSGSTNFFEPSFQPSKHVPPRAPPPIKSKFTPPQTAS